MRAGIAFLQARFALCCFGCPRSSSILFRCNFPLRLKFPHTYLCFARGYWGKCWIFISAFLFGIRCCTPPTAFCLPALAFAFSRFLKRNARCVRCLPLRIKALRHFAFPQRWVCFGSFSSLPRTFFCTRICKRTRFAMRCIPCCCRGKAGV